MTRLRADLLLLFAAIIWGTAFVAQKTGMQGLSPYGFVAVRFLMSFLVIMPFAIWERRQRGAVTLGRQNFGMLLTLCAVFTLGVIFQQFGILYTSVTNAGFLTGLYVVMVPFMAWVLFRKRPTVVIWVASLMAIGGVWLLNGATLTHIGRGDFLVLGCAACFALHMVLVGVVVQKMQRPFFLAALQYGVCAAVALVPALLGEGTTLAAVQANFWPLAYAGVVSGGLAYTIQPVAQQYTPSSDAAIIMSGESLFAALAGAVMLGDRLAWIGWVGCALILGAMLLVEAGALLFSSSKSAKTLS